MKRLVPLAILVLVFWVGSKLVNGGLAPAPPYATGDTGSGLLAEGGGPGQPIASVRMKPDCELQQPATFAQVFRHWNWGWDYSVPCPSGFNRVDLPTRQAGVSIALFQQSVEVSRQQEGSRRLRTDCLRVIHMF